MMGASIIRGGNWAMARNSMMTVQMGAPGTPATNRPMATRMVWMMPSSPLTRACCIFDASTPTACYGSGTTLTTPLIPE